MIKRNLPALIISIVLLAFWQLGASILNKPYIIPTPIEVVEKIWELRGALFLTHLPATLKITLIGFFISVILGVFLAVIMDWNKTIKKALYPLVVISQTIPTPAIAPLFILWFGYGLASKVVVTVLITFFAITVTVFDGLLSTKREQEELLKTMGASKIDIFIKLKIPSALPNFFSAMKMSIPIAIIGAAIGEWLGAQQGLGFFSRRMMTQLSGAGVFAPIVIMSVMAASLVAIVSGLENIFVRGRKEM